MTDTQKTETRTRRSGPAGSSAVSPGRRSARQRVRPTRIPGCRPLRSVAGPVAPAPSDPIDLAGRRAASPGGGQPDPGLPIAVGFGSLPVPVPAAAPLSLCPPVVAPLVPVAVPVPLPVVSPESIAEAAPTPARAPRQAPAVAPVRITRRGRLLVTALTFLLVGGVLAAAWQGVHGGTAAPAAPASVVVHDGDTLWDIASRVAPDRDPRAEVAQLQRLNHLESGAVSPGQVLRTR